MTQTQKSEPMVAMPSWAALAELPTAHQIEKRSAKMSSEGLPGHKHGPPQPRFAQALSTPDSSDVPARIVMSILSAGLLE